MSNSENIYIFNDELLYRNYDKKIVKHVKDGYIIKAIMNESDIDDIENTIISQGKKPDHTCKCNIIRLEEEGLTTIPNISMVSSRKIDLTFECGLILLEEDQYFKVAAIVSYGKSTTYISMANVNGDIYKDIYVENVDGKIYVFIFDYNNNLMTIHSEDHDMVEMEFASSYDLYGLSIPTLFSDLYPTHHIKDDFDLKKDRIPLPFDDNGMCPIYIPRNRFERRHYFTRKYVTITKNDFCTILQYKRTD